MVVESMCQAGRCWGSEAGPLLRPRESEVWKGGRHIPSRLGVSTVVRNPAAAPAEVLMPLLSQGDSANLPQPSPPPRNVLPFPQLLFAEGPQTCLCS